MIQVFDEYRFILLVITLLVRVGPIYTVSILWANSWDHGTYHRRPANAQASLRIRAVSSGTDFHSQHPMSGCPVWNLASTAWCFFGKRSLKISWIWVILDKVNEWRWPWVVINRHVIICLNIFTNLYRTGFNSFSEIYSWSIFPYKSKREQIWPCCKIGQCQSRVIIQMWLYSSNQCCLPSFKVIGLLVPEKIFKVFTIYGHGAHLGHVT